MKKIEVSKLLPVIMLIVLIVIGSQLSESFFTLSNLSNIVQYAVESAFIGIGMTFVLLIGGIDLSVGSVLAFASVVSAKMALESMSIPLILIVVILIGLGCGAVNGLLVTRFRIEPFSRCRWSC